MRKNKRRIFIEFYEKHRGFRVLGEGSLMVLPMVAPSVYYSDVAFDNFWHMVLSFFPVFLGAIILIAYEYFGVCNKILFGFAGCVYWIWGFVYAIIAFEGMVLAWILYIVLTLFAIYRIIGLIIAS